MDILLLGTNGGAQIRPVSIHGMLWLQTHFDDLHWKALSNNQVRLPLEDAKLLTQDAENAGLKLSQLSELTTASTI